ncbi:MAG: TRAM domain-containing protein [Thermoprotei archaeon]|nr:TRAM domain-containing protein [Thermoprotei archaeon]
MSRRFGKSRGRRPGLWKPRVGEEYTVKILEISRRGDGIAKIRGLIVFVPGVSPGDSVKVRITRVGRRYATAEVVSEEAE